MNEEENMQHGTKQERAEDLIAGSIEVLKGLKARQGVPVGDVIANLRTALRIVDETDDALREIAKYEPGNVHIGPHAVKLKQIARSIQ